MQEEKNTIAIVAGRGGYNELGLIRSCGEANFNVILVAPSKGMVKPIYKSKYIVKWIDRDLTDSEILLKTLSDIESEFMDNEFIIFPATDLISELLDKNYNKINSKFIFPHAHGNLYKLMDKAEMAQLAFETGLHVPVFKRFDLNQTTLTEFNTPCIIKPLRSIKGSKADIALCKSTEELVTAINIYHSKGTAEILIQNLIVGDNINEIAVTGVSLPNGEVIIKGMIHKKRIRGNGSTVYATYKDDLPLFLENKIRKFIKKTGYIGIFDIEFLHNEEVYNFIECNFRNGAYGYAVTSAGFNIPYYYYMGSSSKEVDKPVIKNITFMEERSDILNVMEKQINLLKWILDVFKSNTLLWWNWKDPKPMLKFPSFLKNIYAISLFKNTSLSEKGK